MRLWQNLVWILIGAGAASTSALEPGEEIASLYAGYGIKIPEPAPARGAGEGAGPYARLVIDGVMLVDGLGSPPRGPVSIVIEQDKIVSISNTPPSASEDEQRLDGRGMTALPGFVDAHVHIGNAGQGQAGPITPPAYVFKLWLAHGITTVRDVGEIMGLQWTVAHARRSAAGQVVAPR
ncbi:MAG: amidohydrolase, partial [Pseudomonadota bacterium]